MVLVIWENGTLFVVCSITYETFRFQYAVPNDKMMVKVDIQDFLFFCEELWSFID